MSSWRVGGDASVRRVVASCHSSSFSNASSASMLDLPALMANRGWILPYWYWPLLLVLVVGIPSGDCVRMCLDGDVVPAG